MLRPTKFEIKQTVHRAGLTLSIEGELDIRTIAQLSDRLAEALDNGAHELTLDLRELAFMDSSGLRLLIEFHDRSREEGWRLTLVAPEQEMAALVLRSTGADQALPFVHASEP
jgi:anti-sigma B factor antagonist